ncbi:CUB domain-containing protein [Aphelenchoides besseyi]|nr:CUB domain-containing protein [Aphelenchoides besseyi]
MWTPFVLFILLQSPYVYGHSRLQCDDTPYYSSDVMTYQIKSPGFPTKYAEPTYDVLEIHQVFYVGSELKTVKQAVLSGHSNYMTEFYSQISGGFQIRFLSDSTDNNYSGFRLTFQRYQPTPGRFVCPQIYAEAFDTHSKLPSFPSDTPIPSQISCPFYITTAQKDGVVELLIVDIGENIMVEIFDSEYDSARTPIKQFSGLTLTHTPQSVITGEKVLFMIVHIRPPKRETNFEVVFYKTVSPCDCGISEFTVNTTGRLLTSPNFPGLYCNKLNCRTRILADPLVVVATTKADAVIQLKFWTLDVEAMHDFFGLYAQNRILKVLTPYDDSSTRKIETFTFDTHDVAINFTTDPTVVQNGYNLTAKVIIRGRECRCPSLENSIYATKSSDTFSFNLLPHCPMDCFWKINVPTSFQAVRLILNISVVLGDSDEFVEVYQEGDNTHIMEIDRINSALMPTYGNTTASRVIVMPDHFPVTLWYHHGDSFSSNLSFNRQLKVDYKWLEGCNCGNLNLNADDTWKLNQSPEFPLPYCNDMNCTYVIQASEGETIAVNVTSFYDGPTWQSSRIELLTGVTELESLIKSTGNSMTVMFSTDASIQTEGYQFYYHAERPEGQYEAFGLGYILREIVEFGSIIGLVCCVVYAVRRYDLISTVRNNFNIRNVMPRQTWLPFNSDTNQTQGFAVWNSREQLSEEV